MVTIWAKANFPRRKKHQKHKHKNKQEKRHQKELKPARQRRVIVYSDDEDEARGEWLVPQDEQRADDLGKAGGTDDENADGGGDTLASVDSSISRGEDESKSNLDSFIVHDTDSEDEARPVRNKHQKRPPRLPSRGSDDEANSEGESDDSGSDEDSSEDDSGSEA